MTLAHDRHGAGPPVVLLHGTNSDRHVWDPIIAPLAERRTVYALDLPAHGESPPSALEPAGFAREVAETLAALGVDRPQVVGHSIGGWTALELAALGVAGAVLALAPAGLWRDTSPPQTNVGLWMGWTLGRMTPARVSDMAMRTKLGRRFALRGLVAGAGELDPKTAIAAARTARASRHFPAHFRATRKSRFTAGGAIGPDVPVRVVWGERDTLAHFKRNRFEDELPTHAQVETWPECGHIIMWDAPERTVAAVVS